MTTNPPSVADTDALSVRRTITIEAPVEKVWAAVTEPAHISRWFGEARFEGVGAAAHGTLSWPDNGGIPIRVEAIDAPRMVSYRWSNQSGPTPGTVDEARSTIFTFTLDPLEGATRLTVVETGFERVADPLAELEDHRGGWDSELDELVAYLEGGA